MSLFRWIWCVFCALVAGWSAQRADWGAMTYFALLLLVICADGIIGALRREV